MGASGKDSDKRYTFVTVVYEAEYPLLLLHARSMRLYCPSQLVERIIIVDNCERDLSPRLKNVLPTEYGDLEEYLTVVSSREIGQMDHVSGYDRQQIIKILISRIISTERYIILDAKNHLVFPLARDSFETADGRVPITPWDYQNSEPLRPPLESTLSYLGLNSSLIFHFPACQTPFVFYTKIARDLINYCVTREKKSFERTFSEVTNRFMEFFLYSGYTMLRGDFDKLYALAETPPTEISATAYCPGVWGFATDTNESIREVAKALANQSPFFSLHRRAAVRLNRLSRQTIADFWSSRGLFESSRSAKRFLVRFRLKLISDALRKRAQRAVKQALILLYRTCAIVIRPHERAA